jgi:REP element-mobilizing transposase RayT
LKIRKYQYRRNLPHLEKPDRVHFITFDTYRRWELPPLARDLVMKRCLHDNGSKIRLLIAVVMPDHVHLVFLPLPCQAAAQPGAAPPQQTQAGLAEDPAPVSHDTKVYSFAEILGGIKGASAHSINKALKRSGRVWQDESFDHVVRCAEKLEDKIRYVRENPVRKGLVSRPEDYKWLWEECL